MVAREYYDYRRAIYVDITHKAILVDTAGTLLAPTEPMAQAEEARIAQEIQKKREKDGRDTELEKHKTMDGDAGNSRFHGDPLGSALNNPRADAEKDKELNSKDSSRTKSREGRRSRSISLSPRGRQRSFSQEVFSIPFQASPFL